MSDLACPNLVSRAVSSRSKDDGMFRTISLSDACGGPKLQEETNQDARRNRVSQKIGYSICINMDTAGTYKVNLRHAGKSKA